MKYLKKILFGVLLFTFFFIPNVSAFDLHFDSKNVMSKDSFIDTVLPSYDSNGKMDGYLYIVSNSTSSEIRLIKYDFSSEVVFSKSFSSGKDPFSNITVSSITANDSSNVKGISDVLVTVNNNGNQVFSKQYGGNGTETGFLGVNSYNNNGVLDGYIVLVESSSSDLGVDPGLVLIKYDLKGNILFQKNINDFSWLDRILFYVKDGKLDSTIDFSTNTIMRNSSTGTVFVINTDYSIENFSYSYTADGTIDGIIVVGNDDSMGYIAKYDLAGNLIKVSKSSDYYYTSVMNNVLPDGTNNGYIISAMRDNYVAFLRYNFDLDLECTYVFNDDNIYYISTALTNYNSNGKQNGYMFIGNSELGETVQIKYLYSLYEIVKKDTNSGIIIVNSEAMPGEVVKVSVNPKDGYSLKRIVVKDEDGKEIEVSSDGTFVMPDGKVTVTAIYDRIVNPDTVSTCYIVLSIVLVVAFGAAIVVKSRRQVN